MKVAMIGGTGDMGYGLALRLLRAGHKIFLGSRRLERVKDAEAEAKYLVPEGKIIGMDNAAAVAAGELAVIAVPASGHRETLLELREGLREKAVLDITIPLAFKPLRYAPPAEGSNALETAAILGEGCRVAAGLHTVSAALLRDLERPLDVDALLVGNDAGTKEQVIELLAGTGIRGYDAGSLMFSPVVESLTPMLIGMNKRYGSNHIGIRLTGF